MCWLKKDYNKEFLMFLKEMLERIQAVDLSKFNADDEFGDIMPGDELVGVILKISGRSMLRFCSTAKRFKSHALLSTNGWLN